jgi:hypothetical protein
MFWSSGKRALAKRGVKKMDALVTGMILWGIITSIYGIKRTEKARDELKRRVLEEGERHTLGSIIKMLIFGVEMIEKESKPATLRQKIVSFFRWNK